MFGSGTKYSRYGVRNDQQRVYPSFVQIQGFVKWTWGCPLLLRWHYKDVLFSLQQLTKLIGENGMSDLPPRLRNE